ncbi:MAG: cytochrome c biogenesis protein CcsA [Verrucomicrobia bacterium]|nr:cytochrome c biogenesis protein CcsA [Verrucomicrobiota bacterium]
MKKLLIALLASASIQTAPAQITDFGDASRIVVQNAGRKKPLHTFASESLQTISGRRTLTDHETGKRMEAMEVMVSIWTGARDWEKVPLVLIADAGLKDELKLPRTERLFSFETLVAIPALGEMQEALMKKRGNKEALTPLENEAETVISRAELLSRILKRQSFTVVPDPNSSSGTWVTIPRARQHYDETTVAAISSSFKQFSDAYASGNAVEFKAKSASLREQLQGAAGGNYLSTAAINREVHYNQFHPFRWAWMLYLISFFVLLPKRGYRIGLAIFTAGLAMNLYGFVIRTWIAGRAPVTNMYESVIWVALGIAAFAFVFELIYKARVYALSAAPLAVLGLILADMLPSVLNPSIGPLPPVLRDNFWLVTHVLSITLGYSAFGLAMGLAHIILGKYLLKPNSVDEHSYIHHLLYRTLQIGVLLLAAGTILGGVWANYSWGRFWGWDPKETWALIALLLYIFAIHGKIAGWWGNFGMAVAAAISFNGILMAWYGVNFVLGKGLHSYGFGGGGVQWVALIVSIDLAFVLVCVIKKLRTPKTPVEISSLIETNV